MYEQLDIFSFLDETGEDSTDTYSFSWDSDINEIYSKLTALASKYRLSIGKTEWAIWEHVPQYGYRMTFTISLRKEDMTDKFLSDLSETVEFAKRKKVEISPAQPLFYKDDEKANMYIFSTFMDKERQKIK